MPSRYQTIYLLIDPNDEIAAGFTTERAADKCHDMLRDTHGLITNVRGLLLDVGRYCADCGAENVTWWPEYDDPLCTACKDKREEADIETFIHAEELRREGL